jgi:hypothetical protein
MKIYINNLNINIANDLHEQLKEHIYNSDSYIKVFTNEGMYKIYHNKIVHLFVNNDNVKIYNHYYKNLTLIADKSSFREDNVTGVHGTDIHSSLEIEHNCYRLHGHSSKCVLIIEYCINNGKREPFDIYFTTMIDDLDDFLLKEQLIEFLSTLN